MTPPTAGRMPSSAAMGDGLQARPATPAVATDILVEAGSWPPERELRALAERAVVAATERVGRVRPGSELSVVFTDDAHIAALNAAWRGKVGATNVLSFPAGPPRGGLYGPVLGDIVVAAETLRREAASAGLTLADHLTHLLVHGFLHLLGFDHETEAEAEAMERLETAILAGLEIADPYAG